MIEDAGILSKEVKMRGLVGFECHLWGVGACIPVIILLQFIMVLTA